MSGHLFEVSGTESTNPFEDLPRDPVSESQARSSLHGREFDHEAFDFLEQNGAQIIGRYIRVLGYPLDAEVEAPNGMRFYVDAHGSPDRLDHSQAGMRRTDTMLKFGFKALRLHARGCQTPLLLITSHLPKAGTQSAYFLTELEGVLFDAIATVGDLAGRQRLVRYFNEPAQNVEPLPAPWRGNSQLPLDLDPFGDDSQWNDDDA